MRLLEKAVPDDVYPICQGLLVSLLSALNLQGQKTAIHPMQATAMKASAKNIPTCRLRARPANFINIAVNRSLPAMLWLPGFKSPYEGSL
jgi:hypothetical protein